MEIKDVEALAALARLDLSTEEKQEVLKDMGGILAYVGQIENLQVEAKPDYQVKNVWREDKTEERDFSSDLITQQFPKSQDGFLKVKKIL
ncbi:MAG: Asp-tRNA(Asn)/Glu-tRNA(Gln) amidotransferase subunit GatC [Candidatus Pacebacteria bacterium]|nr:Asp-tRNA(Asn)/Glu-tRNA(Gln) amidotransferase subunit GatC [Candidatus Paceibacterota bacterium]